MRHPVAVSVMLVLFTPNACEKDGPRWYYTCGDPVCVGYTVKEGVPLCGSQGRGSRCDHEGLMCDPRDDCNRLFVCSVTDPGLGLCPDRP